MLMYKFGTLIDGICLDDSTWLKVHHWYYLISKTIGICLRYMVMALGSWWRHIMSDMTLVWHIGRCTLFGMLVDAHGWHGWNIGRRTWLSH